MTSLQSEPGIATSVVIPAYNERGNIRPLIEELLSVIESEAGGRFGPYEVVIVDDGSTDGTTDQVATLATEHERVGALVLQRNFGQSAAISAGVDYASGDRIVTMDGDRQNDPADIPDLLRELEAGSDCVKGWRRDRRDAIGKRLSSAIHTALTWRLGPRIHDFACGIAAYRTVAIRDIPIYGEVHRYIPAMLRSKGYRVTEIPVNHRPRGAGNSKYGTRRLGRGFVDLLFHAYWANYASRPLHAFGVAALVVLLVGGALVSGSILASVAGLVFPIPTWTILALVGLSLTVVLATVLAAAGVVLETMTRRHFRSARPYRLESVVEGSQWPEQIDQPVADAQDSRIGQDVGPCHE